MLEQLTSNKINLKQPLSKDQIKVINDYLKGIDHHIEHIHITKSKVFIYLSNNNYSIIHI